MYSRRKILREKGAALVSVMFVAVIIAGLAAAYVMRSVQSAHATRCDLAGERALHLAEAGLDLAIAELVSAQGGGDGDGVVSGQLGAGTFSVQSLLIQPPLYRLTSTAVVDDVTREIEIYVVLQGDDSLLDPPAAVTIISDEGETGVEVDFDGNAFTVSGHDTNLNGSGGTQPSVSGLAVLDNDSVQDIINSLNDSNVQDDNIAGAASTPSVSNVSDICDISLQKIDEFAERMRICADLKLVRIDVDGYPVTVEINVELGTDDDPKITYVDGSLELRGTCSGTGILVVNGDIAVRGDFDFHGLIVVTGAAYFFDAEARGDTKIHGAIVIGNPVSDPCENENLDLRGNVDIWYSSEGLDLAEQAMQGQDKPLVISWRRTR